jgi:hypothetical protein
MSITASKHAISALFQSVTVKCVYYNVEKLRFPLLRDIYDRYSEDDKEEESSGDAPYHVPLTMSPLATSSAMPSSCPSPCTCKSGYIKGRTRNLAFSRPARVFGAFWISSFSPFLQSGYPE